MLTREEQEAVDKWAKGLEPGGASTQQAAGAKACQATQSGSCWFSRIIEKLKGNKK